MSKYSIILYCQIIIYYMNIPHDIYQLVAVWITLTFFGYPA